MKTKMLTPLNNNVLIRRIEDDNVEKTDGGIILPAGVDKEVTEVVEIVAISPEIALPGASAGWLRVDFVKPGRKALIHRGLNGTPITHDGEEYMMIGYVNLIAVL